MDARKEYERWLHSDKLTEYERQELTRLGKKDSEIHERFGRQLAFGTGGLRGVMGLGLNRMNVYTVRRVSHALGCWVKEQGGQLVVIGYDCRHQSREFAIETACTLAALGLRAEVAPELCPTPELSYSVRRRKAAAGVMITASHNPPEYNGYKVYGPDGGQVLPEIAAQIVKFLSEPEDIFQLPVLSEEIARKQDKLSEIPSEVRQSFVETVVHNVQSALVSQEQRRRLTVLYTPLHGTGRVPVMEAMKLAGYSKFQVFAPQAHPDPDFSTVQSPNPEEAEALSMAIQAAGDLQADIVLGTDPDADRVGIAVRTSDGQYELMTGNQVGALLADFLVRSKRYSGELASNSILFKTIVTANLGAQIASHHGVAVEETLTGFKFIGGKITEYERSGQYKFLLGYEESYGYLLSDMVRDKDAVQAVLGICEMAAYHLQKGHTLHDALEELYKEFGYSHEFLLNFHLEGEDGQERMIERIDELRKTQLHIPNMQLVRVEDYEKGVASMFDESLQKVGQESLSLPKSDVLKFMYRDGSWMAVRPSGTEPKLKAYVSATGENALQAAEKAERMRKVIEDRMQ
ncbi:phospho-sugar mutase [Alicyclobacillus sp. TC]|uniref:phospho-sugar mutase n=1 Tax=Alicyclobacillus sp. TC TaxID=2606450 RepID=UPI001932509D|nr:phospho-sugar mutase [Alicyclobacillus sp. TC]QRF22611.1 phospho-sugar mutase [Alicyclobacillus sp. TC]